MYVTRKAGPYVLPGETVVEGVLSPSEHLSQVLLQLHIQRTWAETRAVGSDSARASGRRGGGRGCGCGCGCGFGSAFAFGFGLGCNCWYL